MNLLLIRPEMMLDGDTFRALPEQSLHLNSVLHAKAGDRIRIGMLNGNLGEAELIEPSRNNALLRILSLDKVPPAKKNLRFIIALPRPQSFKKCLHFIASAGIPEVHFIQTARVEKSYWKSAAMEADAIAGEIDLGLQQGCDTVPPVLHFHRSFREWFPEDAHRKLIAHPVNALPCPVSVTEPLWAAIGPEGGFIPSEIEIFRERGFDCVELGSHILRVEFALAYMAGRLTP